MCNRYRLTEGRRALAERYGVPTLYPDDLTVIMLRKVLRS